MIITPARFEDEMIRISKIPGYDPEGKHGRADDLMCKVLDSLGYGAGVKIFQDMEKWYS